MKHDEFDLEHKCRLYARRKGWLAWKNENNGNKGIPDDSFFFPRTQKFFFVEFKKDKAAKLRPEQVVWRDKCGSSFLRIDNFEEFKKQIDLHSYDNTGATETI